MELGFWALMLMLAILVLALSVHSIKMESIYRKVSSLSSAQVSRAQLYQEISSPQGSTFNALVIAAWSLFFTALAYFYFLTPRAFSGYSYLGVPSLASSDLGLLIFGLLILLPAAIVSSKLLRVYSFYEVPKWMKSLFLMVVPLLGLSLICSAYLGVLYPTGTSWMAEGVAFTSLLLTQMVLLLPIAAGILGVSK